MSPAQNTDLALLGSGARVFVLVLLAGPVALSGDAQSMVSAILLAAVWLGGTLADTLRRVPSRSLLAVETSLTTFLAAWILPDSTVLLPALIVAPLLGGLHRRTQGVVEAAAVQVVVLTATLLPRGSDLASPAALVIVLFTWLMVGVGIGFMGAVLHRVRMTRPSGTSYRDARRLISQLLDLSGELTAGLDPVDIAERIIDLTREEIPLLATAVHVAVDDHGATVLTGDPNIETDDQRSALVRAVTLSRAPSKAGADVGFPLLTDAGLAGIVTGTLQEPAPGSSNLESALADLVDVLRPAALQLDTALLFSRVRADATAEERRRLARELHDGVAQDLASLGYLIDDLAASSSDPDVAGQANVLRAELSQVVAELRRSVFSLRSAASSEESVAERVESFARHLRTKSDTVLDVRLDESTARPRPEVEAEILRIIQEATTNALRHSHASRITVAGRISAVCCEVSIEDNGVGLQPGREDSYGLRIMQERARRIGGVLEIGRPESGIGTRVRVTTGTAAPPTRFHHEAEGAPTP